MNNSRRKSLSEAINLLRSAYYMTETVCDAEEDSMDRVPENFQGTERYSQSEEAVDNLNDALDKIDDAISCIEEAIQQ